MIVLWFLIKIFFGRLLEVYIFPCIQFCFQFQTWNWIQNWKQLETTGNKTGNNWYKTGNNWIQKLDTTGDSWHFMNSQPILKNLYAKWRYERALSFRYKISSKHHQIPMAINGFKTEKFRSKIVDLSSKINHMEGVEVSDPKCFSKNNFEIDHIRSW